jgi:hypothetical protein
MTAPGSYDASLPNENMQDPDLGIVARTGSAATSSTRAAFNLGAAYPIKIVMVYLPNATLNATVRVQADDAFDYSSIDYDSGALNLYPTTFFPAGTEFYGQDVGGQAMTQELYDEGLRYPFVHILSTEQSYRYWLIDFDDTGNPDGYLDIARVFIGSAYRPAVNWRQGGSHGYENVATSIRTQGGKKRGITLPSWRTAQLTLPKLPEDEATIQALDMMRRMKTTEQFAFVFDEDDTTHLQRRSYLATFGDVRKLTYPASTWVDWPFTVEEEL